MTFTFNPSNQPVRVEMVSNKPWFVAKDLCAILEHSNHKVAIQGLDDDEVRKVYLTDSLGREQETYVVNESVLTREIEPEKLAKIVDEVAFDYADGLLRGCDDLVPGPRQAANLFYLKMIRDALWQAARPDAAES